MGVVSVHTGELGARHTHAGTEHWVLSLEDVPVWQVLLLWVSEFCPQSPRKVVQTMPQCAKPFCASPQLPSFSLTGTLERLCLLRCAVWRG